ncbi:hypothetical protein [Achromobacter xylosoxidans]|uniref:hypothetical protein n=1 Tax=Alcaligenes xylosoxydans xylosoxydans TaxID=85698 RepID=UPI001F13AB69|nr:hypothetical protein [Achromobacter xylosoxidans]
MKTTEQRLEELETTVTALVILSTTAFVAAAGDGAPALIRTIAAEAPDLTADVRTALRLIAVAAEGMAT